VRSRPSGTVRLQFLAPNPLAQGERGLDHERPVHAFAKIQIEHEHVRVLEVIHGGISRMQLNDIHVEEPQESWPASKRP
jgi:hypothetical protein